MSITHYIISNVTNVHLCFSFIVPSSRCLVGPADGDIDSESNKMGLHVTFCFKGDDEESEDDDYIPSEDWKKVDFR